MVNINKLKESAGKALKDARTAMAYFIGQLPPETHPSNSEGRQGYIHCYAGDTLNGGQDYRISFRIRYFNKEDGVLYAKYFDDAKKEPLWLSPMWK